MEHPEGLRTPLERPEGLRTPLEHPEGLRTPLERPEALRTPLERPELEWFARLASKVLVEDAHLQLDVGEGGQVVQLVGDDGRDVTLDARAGVLEGFVDDVVLLLEAVLPILRSAKLDL